MPTRSSKRVAKAAHTPAAAGAPAAELALEHCQSPSTISPATEGDGGKREGEIQNFFTFEDLLYKLVVEANELVGGDGCSIFLWDDEIGRHVLRESTVMTPFIGQYSLDHTKNVDKPRCGITSRVAAKGEAHFSPDVRQDKFWNWYGHPEAVVTPTSQFEHGEVGHERLLSLIAVPIKNREGTIKGVLRVVKSRDNGRQFTEADFRRIRKLVADNERDILTSLSLGKLIEIGSIQDLEKLCRKAVRVLTRMVEGKGCSIFLLDEENSSKGKLRYKCIATTQLERRTGGGLYEKVRNHEEAYYELPEDYKMGRVTAYVLTMKRNLVIDDLHELDFEAHFGFPRQEGGGKFSEHFERKGHRPGTGATMSTPLFFRERFDPSTPAMGIIRLTKPSGDPPFQPHEQRRFFSFAERLSKAILQVRYINLLNVLSTIVDKDEQFRRVVREVPKLIGGNGCSLFAGYPQLEMKATYGRLERKLEQGEIKPYDLADERAHGFSLTGAVVHHREPLYFNTAEEREELARSKGITSVKGDEYEIERLPSRFMAVPILVGERAEGVIRIPKTQQQSPFTANDLAMLMSIAKQLGRTIENADSAVLSKFFHYTFQEELRQIILRNPSLLSITSRTVTICFWDIRGFSRLCESLKAKPALIADFINEYCELAAKTIFKHGGILDKFIGDGVMALFGALPSAADAPEAADEEEQRHTTAALSAIETARELRSEFEALTTVWKQKLRKHIPEEVEIGLGCGIHTGEVLVGMIGTDIRSQFTALGPHVNLASRIEGRADGSQILLSQTAAAFVEGSVSLRRVPVPIDNIKNIHGTFILYEVTDDKPGRHPAVK